MGGILPPAVLGRRLASAGPTCPDTLWLHLFVHVLPFGWGTGFSHLEFWSVWSPISIPWITGAAVTNSLAFHWLNRENLVSSSEESTQEAQMRARVCTEPGPRAKVCTEPVPRAQVCTAAHDFCTDYGDLKEVFYCLRFLPNFAIC